MMPSKTGKGDPEPVHRVHVSGMFRKEQVSGDVNVQPEEECRVERHPGEGHRSSLPRLFVLTI